MDQHLRNFIPNLRCPVSRAEIREMNAQELESLNNSIHSGSVSNREGKKIEEPLKEALVSTDGAYVYPVTDGFVAEMLPDSAISTKGMDVIAEQYADDKKKVRDFYDDYGWQKSDDSSYKDTVTFEDRRPVSQKYWSRCHLRLNKHLGSGDYLLDVASGAIPNDEYLTYSQSFKLRICMDFSILAVKEAAVRLNGKGIFILGDMTCIPIADHCIDAVISMHTVYHVPMAQQTQAVAESYRVLKPGKKAVIVYSWRDSELMKAAFGLWKPVLNFYKQLRGKAPKMLETQAPTRPDLFVQQQNYDWFSRHIKKQYHARLEVYSAISRSFSHTFLRKKMFGYQLSAFIYWLEDKFPKLMGRWGQYPVFVLNKQ